MDLQTALAFVEQDRSTVAALVAAFKADPSDEGLPLEIEKAGKLFDYHVTLAGILLAESRQPPGQVRDILTALGDEYEVQALSNMDMASGPAAPSFAGLAQLRRRSLAAAKRRPRFKRGTFGGYEVSAFGAAPAQHWCGSACNPLPGFLTDVTVAQGTQGGGLLGTAVVEDRGDGYIVRAWAIAPGWKLGPGQAMLSPAQNAPGTPHYGAGQFAFVMQTDGNFVVYNMSTPITPSGGEVATPDMGTGTPARTNTQGHPGSYITFQADGNLVIYDAGNRPIWSSETAGHPNSLLFLQSDGNMLIYPAAGGGKIWAISGTAGSGFWNAVGSIASTLAVVFPVVSIPVLLATGNVQAAVNVATTSVSVAKDVVTGNMAGAVRDATQGVINANTSTPPVVVPVPVATDGSSGGADGAAIAAQRAAAAAAAAAAQLRGGGLIPGIPDAWLLAGAAALVLLSMKGKGKK